MSPSFISPIPSPSVPFSLFQVHRIRVRPSPPRVGLRQLLQLGEPVRLHGAHQLGGQDQLLRKASGRLSKSRRDGLQGGAGVHARG